MPLTFKEIQDLVTLINKSNLAEFKLKDGEQEVLIRTAKYSKNSGTTQIIQSAPATMPAVVAAPVITAVEAAPKAVVAEAPKAAPAVAVEAPQAGLLEIKSPIVGTFYRSSSPDKPAYAKVGDMVDKGQKVCIIEAMKLFNEIESDVKGKIVKVLVDDASPVEYDQVLFLVEPA